MIKLSMLALALAFGSASVASAAFPDIAATHTAGPIIKVGEGCGAYHWRDHNGYCHPFGGPGGNNRGTRIECPPGLHIGQGGKRCWPNR